MHSKTLFILYNYILLLRGMHGLMVTLRMATGAMLLDPQRTGRRAGLAFPDFVIPVTPMDIMPQLLTLWSCTLTSQNSEMFALWQLIAKLVLMAAIK